MYTIEKTGQKLTSFSQAVKIASEVGSKVIDNDGLVRWEPVEITEKQRRAYREKLNARKAYEKLTGR